MQISAESVVNDDARTAGVRVAGAGAGFGFEAASADGDKKRVKEKTEARSTPENEPENKPENEPANEPCVMTPPDMEIQQGFISHFFYENTKNREGGAAPFKVRPRNAASTNRQPNQSKRVTAAIHS